MKKLLCIAMPFAMLLLFAGCTSQKTAPKLPSGYFYAAGEDAEYLAVVTIDTNEREFRIQDSHWSSYSEYGTYKIKSGKLTATTQNTRFIFEIKDENTLVLTQFADEVWDWLQTGMEFVYSEDMK